MEARFKDVKGENSNEFYNHFMEELLHIKQIFSDTKHEITDLRKDLTHEISQLKILYDRDLKDSVKELEMKMYAFIVKTVMAAIGAIGALQTALHYMN